MVMRLSLEGDRVKAAAFSGKAQQELDRLQARMDSAQLDRGTFHYTLDDESYVYGYILPGGLRCARIVCTPGVGDVEERVVSVTEQIPDFISGYVRDGRWESAEPDDGNPLTEERPLSVKEFVPSVETAAKMKKDLKWAPRNAKLGVAPWVAFDNYGESQYVELAPNMYSGRMRKLVQALMGFGKNPKKKGSFFGRYFDFVSEEEKRKLKRALPPAYRLEVEKFGLQIRYDFRFYRTHGLTTGSDGKQWITEIGMNRGILAMPLLLHELTTTPKFRSKVESLGRLEALTILDEFGGFPTGEAFPGSTNRVDAWVRAGRVLRLKTQQELSEFYSHSAYASPVGWAFNEGGTEAHNTAYRYGEDGCQVGVHYAVSINISAMDKYEISAVASGLWQALSVVKDREEQYEAVKWKVHRLEEQQLSNFLSMLGSKPIKQVFDEVDAVVCAPLAVASAGISKVSEGKLYWPTKGGQQQIKFPEPLVGGLESHDFRPSKIQNEYPFCDTTMFVMFAGSQLKYVKYYLDPRRVWPENVTVRTGDSQWDIDYALAGDFYVAYSRNMAVPPSFYGSDFDPREEIPDSITETFYKRRFKTILGPWSFGNGLAWYPYNPDLPYSVANFLGLNAVFRTHWFSRDHDVYYGGHKEKKSAVVVPFNDREAYYFADFDRHYQVQEQHVRGWIGIVDPHFGWTNHPYLGVKVTDKSSYSGSDPVALYYMVWTDHGSGWVPIGDQIDSFPVTQNDHPYQFHNRYKYPQLWRSWQVWRDPWAHYTVDLVTSSYFGTIRVLEETYSGPNTSIIDPLWFLPSPDEFGDYQYIGETHNVLGYVDCIVYGIHLLSGERAHKGAYPQAADWLNSQMHVYAYPTFVGVFDA